MLTLGQAIRIGSLIRPQCFGVTHGKARGGFRSLFREVDATCAWGSAYEAVGAVPEEVILEEDARSFRGGASFKKGDTVFSTRVPYEWLTVARLNSACPKCGKSDTVDRLIAHLNDEHQWKRERIADWVEMLECKECQK